MKEKMNKAIESLENNLNTIRTGRANPNLLSRVEVEYYGSMSPVNQVASIQVVEGRQLLIKPFDRSLMSELEKAINSADLGVVAQNEGEALRINIPPLTEERRKEFTKEASKMGEDAKVVIRNIRRDENDLIKKDEELSEDMKKGAQDDVQKATDEYVKKIDEIVAVKVKDIMTI